MVYIAVLLLFIISISVGNLLYKQTNAYKNKFVDIYKFKSVEQLPDASLDLVAIGSNSPKFAFDFGDINQLKCSNWCIGPETFQYDYIILHKFSNKLKKGATVVLTVCPLIFFHHRFHPHSDLYKYYALLDKEEMPDFNYMEYLRYYKYPVVFNPLNIVRIFYDAKEFDRLKLNANLYDVKGLKANAAGWIKNVWNPAYQIDIESMKPLSETNKKDIEGSKYWLRQIAEFCKNRGLKLLLVYPPLTAELKTKFSEEFIEQHINRYVEEALGGIGFKMVDYMHDARFYDMNYYIDAFFMNRIGAKLFTETFFKENILN